MCGTCSNGIHNLVICPKKLSENIELERKKSGTNGQAKGKSIFLQTFLGTVLFGDKKLQV